MKKKKTKKSEIVRVCIFFIIIFTLEILLLMSSRVQCREIGYEISLLVKTKSSIFMEREKLKVELARLKSPGRLYEIAKNKFGLNMPLSEQIERIPCKKREKNILKSEW